MHWRFDQGKDLETNSRPGVQVSWLVAAERFPAGKLEYGLAAESRSCICSSKLRVGELSCELIRCATSWTIPHDTTPERIVL